MSVGAVSVSSVTKAPPLAQSHVFINNEGNTLSVVLCVEMKAYCGCEYSSVTAVSV